MMTMMNICTGLWRTQCTDVDDQHNVLCAQHRYMGELDSFGWSETEDHQFELIGLS